MNILLLQKLQCPLCNGGLVVSHRLEPEQADLTYGVLACERCASEYPVIEAIPIMMASDATLDILSETLDDVRYAGPMVKTLVATIKMGKAAEAFALLLAPVTEQSSRWTLNLREPRSIAKDLMTRTDPSTMTAQAHGPLTSTKNVIRPFYRRLRARYRRRRSGEAGHALVAHIQHHRAELYATELFHLIYRDVCGYESIADYFIYRFGQPRHLAALCVLSLLRDGGGPVLDVACGAGHLSHYLSYGNRTGRVTGMDRDFTRLFIAKHFVAPQAQFVCASTNTALPFRSDAFAAVLCSDAFHCFRYKGMSVREFERVMKREGTMALARFANGNVPPHEGYELPPGGYQALLGDLPSVMVGESALRASYLGRHGPDLSAAAAALAGLDEEKWLTIVASRNPDVFRKHGSFSSWPHAVGRMGVNPIYVPEAQTAEGVGLRFSFPGEWYRFEDSEYPDYAPPSANIESSALESVSTLSPETLELLIAKWVVIGMPDRYVRPLSQVMNRLRVASP